MDNSKPTNSDERGAGSVSSNNTTRNATNGSNGVNNGANGLAKPLLHFSRYLPLFIILGLAIHFFLPVIASLENSAKVLRSMAFGFVALALLVESCSYLGSGYMLSSFVALGKQRLSVWKGALIALGSYSVGLVAGGMVASVAATYRWLNQHGSEREWAAIAGVLPSTLITLVLAVISVFGMLQLFITHNLTEFQLFAFAISMLPTVALVAVLVLGSAYRPKVEKLVEWLGFHWAKILKRHYDPTKDLKSLSEFYFAWEMLKGGKWKRPLLGAAINCALDMAALYFIFLAAGYPIDFSSLLTGYGLPLLFGRAAFFLPGGLGVVESSMAALFTTLGVPDATSVVVVLAFRLVSFWIPSLTGFLAVMFLSNTKKRSAEGQAPEN